MSTAMTASAQAQDLPGTTTALVFAAVGGALLLWWWTTSRRLRRERVLARYQQRCETTYQQVIAAEDVRALQLGLPRYQVPAAVARTADDPAWAVAVATTALAIEDQHMAERVRRRGESRGLAAGLLIAGLWSNHSDK